jgi:hypothetical protein
MIHWQNVLPCSHKKQEGTMFEPELISGRERQRGLAMRKRKNRLAEDT